MSKKKQKFKVKAAPLARITSDLVAKLDEIIDLLHVIVENTKKPEPPRGVAFNIEPSRLEGRELQEHRRRLMAEVDGSWQKKPKARAAEEVEDYHGIATTEPYSLPVRIHR